MPYFDNVRDKTQQVYDDSNSAWKGDGWYYVGWSDGGMGWTSDGAIWCDGIWDLRDELDAAYDSATETHLPWVEYLGDGEEPREARRGKKAGGSRTNVKMVAKRALRKRAWTTPYDLDGFDMGRFVEEFDPIGTDVEQWGYDEGYSVKLEDRAHPGFSVWFDVKFDGYGEWECDWNQYIFFTNDSDDVFRKMFQDYYDESGYPWQFEKAEEAALDRISETYGLPNPRA
jgi:hypothetical protein